MSTIFNVADWFLSKESMTHKKLQKLVYYYKAWGLALYDKDLLPDDPFEAWIHGPVNPRLYQKYKDYGWQDIEKEEVDESIFSVQEKDLLSSVWETYGAKCAAELEGLAHSEYPWIEARKGISENEPSHNAISNKTMHDYYLQEYQQYQGV